MSQSAAAQRLEDFLGRVPYVRFLGMRAELAGAAWRYGLLLFVFLFVSRFMNENYLGYVLALWALGYFVAESKNSLV